MVAAVVGAAVAGAAPDHDARPGPVLDRSVPYVGAADVRQVEGHTGRGVTVAVIDTGVDFTHPDLAGAGGGGDGGDGGYNFVDVGQPPVDRNGHGTQVAGVIAADGGVVGVAPGVRILAYKVSDDGESVSSDLIVMAIRRAVEDGADVINISLGVNRTNTRIDAAINDAVRAGVLVVAASGNDGPGPSTIGSPGANPNALTVGATHNNITSSLVSTLEIGSVQYHVIPMLGIGDIPQPVAGNVVYAKYGRDGDVADAGDLVAGSILLVERGGQTEDEVVYFTEKEYAAAGAGAGAVVVYNSEPGIYLGDVSESVTIDGYTPRIPIVSMSQEDGQEIARMVGGGQEVAGELDVFYNPDHIAFFSSRGPASPFYVKPDLVAPGAFINSTDVGGSYNISSGTSFATPHVAGAAALLLEKHPGLRPGQLKSLLSTTSTPIVDAYGGGFGPADVGAGRLDLDNAFGAKLVIEPAFVVMTFSPAKRAQTAELTVVRIGGGGGVGAGGGGGGLDAADLSIDVETPESVRIDYAFADGRLRLSAQTTGAAADGGCAGGDECRADGVVNIVHDGTRYRIPIILQTVGGEVIPRQDGHGRISFGIAEPADWAYAKVSVTGAKTGESITTSLTPRRDSSVSVPEPGEYWVESVISTANTTSHAYDVVQVESAAGAWSTVSAAAGTFPGTSIPQKPVYIAAAVAGAVAVAGLAASVTSGRSAIRAGDRPWQPSDQPP